MKEGEERVCVWADHAMQLVEDFERAHIASAAFWRESGRVLGGTNPFQGIVRN